MPTYLLLDASSINALIIITELLSWYDKQGDRYLTLEEQAQQERLRAEQERLRAEELAQYLRSLGIDPDNLPSQ